MDSGNNIYSSETDERRFESGSAREASLANCPIDVVPMRIEEDRIEEGARELLGHIRPNWSPENTTFTVSKWRFPARVTS